MGITQPVPAFFTQDGRTFVLRGDRIVRDNCEVAVLVSPGYGAGFVTWSDGLSPFEPRIVAAILAGHLEMISKPRGHTFSHRCGRCMTFLEELQAELGARNICLLGTEDLEIQYIPLGTGFQVDEYDGSEYVTTSSGMPYTA